MPRANSFRAHALNKPDEVMLIPDTLKDDRFASHPLVIGEPHVRFYAGVPLLSANGIAVGTICVLDIKPRESDPQQRKELKFLA